MGIEAFPVKPGSCTKAVPGYDVRVLDDDGTEVEASQIGNIVIKVAAAIPAASQRCGTTTEVISRLILPPIRVTI